MGSQSGAARLPERFGPFVLERRLAVGGAGEIYLARPSVGIRPAPWFVIKRPLAGASADAEFRQLTREAELNQAVVHPNVVQVFGAGMIDGRPYLALEYVDGVDAFRLLRTAETERRRLEQGVAVYITRRVANALSSVHAAVLVQGPSGLVHADVSPSNVYLSAEGDVKLGDFGIARTADEIENEVRGKWGYVAPEVLEGEPADHRADLFSLGAVLGELLLGHSIFPGSSQLAVLLAIREANIEPLRRRAGELPPGLFDVLVRCLAREPSGRPDSAAELSEALSPYEPEDERALRVTLGRWVEWARDPARLAQRIEGRVRESVERMQAARAVVVSDADAGEEPVPLVRLHERTSLSVVRRASGDIIVELPFAKLIEMIAVGDLEGHDEVALMGEPYRRIEEVEELARHLLPSTTTTTGVLFGRGVPDYAAQLVATPMLEILAKLREKHETGALFVEAGGSSGPASVRKEIYLQAGRLHHVASSAREELLGEYLIRRGKLSRAQLDSALAELGTYSGRLGDTLVAMKLVEVMDLFRVIRDQGRDRVGALCAWKAGNVAFYRGSQPGAVQFPLDLDLASAMMSGAILAAEGRPETLLPDPSFRVIAGPRGGLSSDRRELGTAPRSVQLVPSLIPSGYTIAAAMAKLAEARSGGRPVSTPEVAAAMVVAQALGWVAFQPSD